MEVPRGRFLAFLVKGAALVAETGVAMKAAAARLFREVLPLRSIAPGDRAFSGATA